VALKVIAENASFQEPRGPGIAALMEMLLSLLISSIHHHTNHNSTPFSLPGILLYKSHSKISIIAS
jgi:hypothetical protein